MHETSYNKMCAFAKEYLGAFNNDPLKIIDIGSQAVLGHKSYKDHFQNPNWRYHGLDIEAGENVDIVVDNPYCWANVEAVGFDVAVSGQALEHIEFPWKTFSEIFRILKPGGLFCLIVPSSGKEHRFPVDCWRFYPDSMHALARDSGFSVIEVFRDIGLGEWQDTFAVFQKPAAGNEVCAFPEAESKAVAFSLYLDALNTKPQNPLYFLNLSELLSVRERADDALSACRAGISVYPGHLGIRQEIVKLLCQRQDWQALAGEVKILLRNHPVTNSSVESIGYVFQTIPRMQVEVYRQLLPEEIPQLRRIANLAENLNYPVLAAAAWETLSLKEPNTEALKANALLALWRSGQAAEAQSGFRAHAQNKLQAGVIERTTVIQMLVNTKSFGRYLEIGVERGINLFQIEAREKLAVDPALKTPCGNQSFPGCRFFEVESDRFFSEPPQDIVESGIDIALIDGLHTYEQALRDVENCLRYLNPNGVIVMHDCLPASEAEAAPTFELARTVPGFNGNWTGDVYKTIAHLRTFRPDLFVAVLDCDHGVGLVCKGQPESMLQVDRETIEHLAYTDLRYSLAHWLNIKPKQWFHTWLASVA